MAMMMKPATANQIFGNTFTPYDLEREKEFFRKVYDENDLTYTDYGIEKILDLHYKRKAPILNLLSRHPKWDASINAIRLDVKMNLDVDRKKVAGFWTWVRKQIRKQLEILDVRNGLGRTADEVRESLYYWQGAEWEEKMENPFLLPYLYSEVKWYLDNTVEVLFPIDEPCQKMSFYLPPGLAAGWFVRMKGVLTILSHPNSYTQFVSEETAKSVNTHMPKLKAVAGMKTSKLVQRYCREIGVDKIKSYEEVTHNGVTTLKDYGYNYHMAMVGDALNPIKIQKPVFISAYSIDFLNMSNGHDWHSCHRLSNWDYDKRGCNCSGTLSYMNDDCSFIFYSLPQKGNEHVGWETEKDIENPFMEGKLERCVFQYKDGKLVQGRVYPQSNDSNNGLREEVRAIVQKVVAECLGEDNMWNVKKGADEICKYVNSTGTHYKDYDYNYNGKKTASISFLKSMCGSKTENEIRNERTDFEIGSYPICADCGSEHDRLDSPNCYDCDGEKGKRECDYCEGWGVEDDMITIGDNAYCCEDCANNDGVWKVRNLASGWCEWVRETDDHVHRDAWSGDLFLDPHMENGIYTENGNAYTSYDNAERDGYVCTEEDGWRLRSECVLVESSYGHVYCPQDSDRIHECPICGQMVHDDFWDSGNKMCSECAEMETGLTE